MGDGHTVGLRQDGTVVAVGDNRYGQCNVDGVEWTNIVAISAGDWHTVGLKSDGTVVSVGRDNNGYDTSSCNIDSWTDIVAISAGNGFTLGLRSDGTIVSSGYDDAGKSSKAELWTSIMIYEEWRK